MMEFDIHERLIFFFDAFITYLLGREDIVSLRCFDIVSKIGAQHIILVTTIRQPFTDMKLFQFYRNEMAFYRHENYPTLKII